MPVAARDVQRGTGTQLLPVPPAEPTANMGEIMVKLIRRYAYRGRHYAA